MKKVTIEWLCQNYVYQAEKGSSQIRTARCSTVFTTTEKKDDIELDLVYTICPSCGEELAFPQNGIIIP